MYSLREETSRLSMGEWACEAALWTFWKHTGMLRANGKCEVMMLDAEKFSDVIVQYPTLLKFTCCYAQIFLQSVYNEEASDLPDRNFESMSDLTTLSSNIWNNDQDPLLWPRIRTLVFTVHGELQGNTLNIKV